MISLKEGSCIYSKPAQYYEECHGEIINQYDYELKEEYSYCPINNLQSFIVVDYTLSCIISSRHLFCFEITRKYEMPVGHDIIDTKYLYLSVREIQTLYNDPKSIWEQAEKWDRNEEEETNE